MKAISIRAPWWWFILHAGKDIENRDWLTKFRGPVMIHATCSRSTGRGSRGGCRFMAHRRTGVMTADLFAPHTCAQCGKHGATWKAEKCET